MKNNIFGTNLREMRTTIGLTQIELSKMSGVGRSAISRIETGRTEPTLVNQIRLMRALSNYYIDLLTRIGSKLKNIRTTLQHLQRKAR